MSSTAEPPPRLPRSKQHANPPRVVRTRLFRTLFASLTLIAASGKGGIALPIYAASPSSSSAPKGPELDKAGARPFAEGVELLKRGDLRGAKKRLELSLELYSGLKDYQLFHLAQVQEALGRRRAAQALYQRVATDFPRSIWRPQVLLKLAELSFDAGDRDRARRLARLAQEDPGASEKIKLEVRMLTVRQLEDAAPIRAYREYWELRMNSGEEGAARARARQAALRSRYPELFARPTKRDILREAKARLAERDADGALRVLRERSFDGHPLAPERDLLLARTVAGTRGIEEAESLYERVWRDYPDSEAAPTALYELAYRLWNNHKDSLAEPLFGRLLEHGLTKDRAELALYALGRIAEEAKRFGTALDRYRRLTESARSPALREEGAWRVGWVHYLAGEYAAASRAFARGAEGRKGGSRARFAYWQARSLEHLEETGAVDRSAGDDPPSRAIYCKVVAADPDGYYAGLAESRLKSALQPRPPERPATFALPDALESRYSFHLSRSRALAELRLEDFAAEELAAVEREARGTEDEASVVAYLAKAYGDVGAFSRSAKAAVRVLQRNAERSWLESRLWRYAYPLAYWDLLRAEAAESHLDPCLALALMRQESFFDPRAVSPAQAFGLMQLLVRTAREVASDSSSAPGSRVSPELLLEPGTNLRLGVIYLSKLLKLTRGNIPRALAAYNAGEDALAKWEARYPESEDDEFVERISYSETRSYVKHVLANFRLYGYLYGDGTCDSPASKGWARLAAGENLRPLDEVCQ